MVVTYEVQTPMMQDARQSAIARARAEGWRAINVVSLSLVGDNIYSITLVVTR